MLYFRRTQKEEAERHKAAEEAKVTPCSKAAQSHHDVVLINPSPSPGSDDFQEDTPKRRLQPLSLKYTSGRVTPSIRGRGRPRKEPKPPSEADKPVHGTKEDLKRWQKKFNAAKWRYEKLTSKEAESYREAENARVKERMESQRQHIIDAASSVSDVYKHIPDTPKSTAREKSRLR